MINSLSKDSHITQLYRPQTSKPFSQGHDCESRGSSATVIKDNTERNFNKPTRAISFRGFLNSDKFMKSGTLKKLLQNADEYQVFFGAAFAILLTCIMRPATIMAIPGKKNADDKKYAAAQSISSGVIGLGISIILANPISAAIKKVFDFDKKENKFLTKNLEYFKKNTKAAGAAKTILNQVPVDIALAPVKAIVTIALLPPILKYVFGLEKKKGTKAKGMNPSVDYSSLNFKSASLPQKKVFKHFTGGNN